MKRFWQFIPMPPRQWLARFGLLVALFLILILVGGRELAAPEPKPAEIAICGKPNKWLTLIDQYLGTNLATAQAGPCATLTAQCQGPFDAYPGFKLSWDPLGLPPPNWKTQIVIPGADVFGQSAGPGFAEWNTVNPMATDPSLVTRADSAGNAIKDDTYYRAAVQYVPTGRARCSGELSTENKYPNQCEAIRTLNFTDDPDLRSGGPSRVVPVTAADCPWQQSETPPIAGIPCGRTVLHASALNSIRGGTTEWGIIGVELCGGSFPCSAGEPVLTVNRSSPPLLYEGDFSDGSTVKLWMEGSQVIAERTSPAGGVCRPIPAMTCRLFIDGATSATWQSDPDGPFPNLTWGTESFNNNDDTITVTEYDASGASTGRVVSSDQASGGPVPMFSSPLEGRFRVRPSDSAKTFRYVGQVQDTGAPNGPDPYAPGSCEAQLTINRETQPCPSDNCDGGDVTCVGGCDPTSSCNAVTISWSPVPNAKLYRVYVGDASGRFIPSIIPNPVPVTPPATTVSISVPQGPASYKFSLETVDQNDNASGLSSPISANVPACIGAFPTPPSLTLSAGPSCDTMRLTWTDAGSETGYEVWRKRVSPPVDPDFAKIANLDPDILTYLATGLSGSTSYSYYVVANAPGGSATSNTASASTPACPGSDFSVSVSPLSRTISPGQSTTYTVTVASANLPTTPITLGVTGLPTGASATLDINPVTTPPADGSVTSTMTVATTSATPLSTSSLTVSGVGASLTRTAGATLIVAAANGAPCVGRCDGSSPPGAPTNGLMCSTPPLLSFAFIYDDPDGDAASRFSFQVATDSGFSSLAVDRQNIVSTAAARDTITQLVEVRRGGGAGMLDYNTSYFWRAQVWDSQGAASGWSSGVAFTTPNHAYPQVDFSTDRPSLNASGPTTVKFTDQTATAPGARIVRWLWTFVSGAATAPDDQNAAADTVLQTRPPTTRSEPSVVYSAPGAKTITLTAQDDGGAEFTCTGTKVLFGGTGASLKWREIKAR
ncbi:hypothetical protein HY573_01135 [Candidatus Parcubacteria bacterium]|nr:hypothetical protein [Candidatus Parcubacteria bacterium]